MKRRVWAYSASFFAFLIFVFGLYAIRVAAQGIDVPGAPKVGEKAPDFSHLDGEGRLFSLADALQEGKILLVFYRGFF